MSRATFPCRHAAAAALLAAVAALPARAGTTTFADVQEQARVLAQRPYAPPPPPSEALARVDFGRWSQVRYTGAPPWGTSGNFVLEPTPPGWLYRDPVALHMSDAQGTTALPFAAGLFDWAGLRLPSSLPAATSFSGFRVLYRARGQEAPIEILRFQGSSYFRAQGTPHTPGLAARALAVNSAQPGKEEFPRFTAFWLDRPAATDRRLRLLALLDSPSITGAYEFSVTPGRTLGMEVHAVLHARRAGASVGLAPLRSMYLQGDLNTRVFDALRGEVHDSDSLTIQQADGAWVHRPLRNPPAPLVHSFSAAQARGFGLCQRDRDEDHYAAPDHGYGSRPCAWVSPAGTWPDGYVQLLEMPAAGATQDNIAATYVTPAPPPGQPLELRYTLDFSSAEPKADVARVLGTLYGGRGDLAHYAVDFAAPPGSAPPEALIDVGAGARLERSRLRPNAHTGGQRLEFDIRRSGTDPVVLRAFLGAAGQTLTETWDHVDLPAPP